MHCLNALSHCVGLYEPVSSSSVGAAVLPLALLLSMMDAVVLTRGGLWGQCSPNNAGGPSGLEQDSSR